MKMRLLGARDLDFKANDGSQVRGMQLFVAYATDGVVGEMTDKLFVRDGVDLPQFKVGDSIDVAFNNRGKVDSVKPIAKQA
jgi:hypothetical protein